MTLPAQIFEFLGEFFKSIPRVLGPILGPLGGPGGPKIGQKNSKKNIIFLKKFIKILGGNFVKTIEKATGTTVPTGN